MRRTIRALAVLALAAPAAAEVVPPAAFGVEVEGRTLHFTRDGMPFGAEQFLPGRRTLWRFADGICAPGRWWEMDGDAICFEYDALEGPICWRMRREGEAFSAHLLEGGVETGFRLDLDRIETAPLDCPGPDVGS